MAKKDIAKVITTLIMAVVLFLVILEVLAGTGPEMHTAAGNLTANVNASGDCETDTCGGETFPLSALFRPKGLVFLILMVAVFIGIIVMFFGLFKGK